MISQDAIDAMAAITAGESEKADLSRTFFETETYRTVRDAIFRVLEAREARLKRGKFEQKGVALIGPAGSGKSEMLAKAIGEYEQIAMATGGREFGHKIVSVIVPGQASISDTCRVILKELDYPTEGKRTEDYLIDCLATQLERQGVAAVHLDEVQDAGRYSTEKTMSSFAKRFRNLMQKPPWPVCLILSSTPEGRDFINHDFTLTRRLRSIDILPLAVNSDGPVLRSALRELIADAGLSHEGLIDVPEFMPMFIHAVAYRFGLAIELTIEAIGEAKFDRETVINLDHFAAAYYGRMGCDENLNPFISEHWRGIDTTRAMDRWFEKQNEPRKRRKRK